MDFPLSSDDNNSGSNTSVPSAPRALDYATLASHRADVWKVQYEVPNAEYWRAVEQQQPQRVVQLPARFYTHTMPLGTVERDPPTWQALTIGAYLGEVVEMLRVARLDLTISLLPPDQLRQYNPNYNAPR